MYRASRARSGILLSRICIFTSVIGRIRFCIQVFQSHSTLSQWLQYSWPLVRLFQVFVPLTAELNHGRGSISGRFASGGRMARLFCRQSASQGKRPRALDNLWCLVIVFRRVQPRAFSLRLPTLKVKSKQERAFQAHIEPWARIMISLMSTAWDL